MTGREHFNAIIEMRATECGFWHGNPHPDSVAALYGYFGVEDDFGLGLALGDCFNWVMLEANGLWRHPDGVPMFDVLGGKDRRTLGDEGVFADCANVAEVERFHWPDIKYCDFSGAAKAADRTLANGLAVLSGTWSSFYHVVSDFFGMENYFCKMYTDPAVVEAVTEHVVDFYLAVNAKWFDIIGDKMDAIFFGNDFGSQLDMLISPEMFDKFVMPYFRKITDQAKRKGYKVVLHSCGAIEKVIPRLIDAGVDALHPVQARARGMDAEALAAKYNGKIVFVGGIDTQELMPFGTASQVADETRRVAELFGPNFIISPSHEALLPNVPPANLAAMSKKYGGGLR